MRILVALIRPKTLFLALAVIITGNAMAAYHGAFRLDIFVLSLLTALSLQILSNLANDYGDGIRGTDTHRSGPERALASGLVSLGQLKLCIVISVIASCIFGLLLLSISLSNPMKLLCFLLLGFISIVAAIKYTVGKFAYGYRSLGEMAVFIFFGLLGVLGSYYLQTNELRWTALLPAIACGFLAAGVLNINNIRDIESDANAGKETLAVKIGFKSSLWMHGIIIATAVICYILFAAFETWWSALWLVLLPVIRIHGKRVITAVKPSKVGEQLAASVLLTFGISTLFAIGLSMSMLMNANV